MEPAVSADERCQAADRRAPAPEPAEAAIRVTLQSENGQAMVSADGIAKAQNGKTKLPVTMNLSGLSSGDYRLGHKGEHDSAPYYYPVHLR